MTLHSRFSKEEQIRAMLDGSMFELLKSRGLAPEYVDIRKYITVDRRELLDFLVLNRVEVDRYLKKHSVTVSDHDVVRIWREGSDFITAWFDHGIATSQRRFAAPEEAVAEHVLVSHGMY